MTAQGSTEGLRVLVVEDEAIVAADLESCLAREGYEVTGVADNGPEALQLVSNRPPDLALVDIRLRGEMDGIALARKLSSEHHVPVIFATAHADEATTAQAALTEPYGYVVKPFDQQSIRVAVEVARARRAAEDRARRLERWLATTLESIGDAIIATDKDGRISLMNVKAETLTGWPREQALGKPMPEVFRLAVEGDEAAAFNIAKQVVEAGVTREVTDGATLRARSGEELFVGSTFAPIRDEYGGVAGIVLAFRDRTAVVQAEARRRELEAKMYQTQRLESLGVLAGGIAHDFNNLLAAVMGNAGLCRKRLPAGSDLTRFLDNIDQASTRGAELCAQMLAYAGKGQFTAQNVDLSELVRDSVELLELSIAKDSVLELELASELPAVYGDLSKLRQIVMNLVMNASEALVEGRGTISVRTGVADLDPAQAAALEPAGVAQPGKYVILEVKDTGAGMDDEARRKLFEPFFTTKFQGRGLGLAAVLGILRSHHGGVLVESTHGKGSLFRVYLPMAKVQRGEERTRKSAAPVMGQGRALVADDESAVRWMASALLKELGFEVDAVANGEEAVEAVRKNPQKYRVALLDLTMPKMNGVEAVRRIRTAEPELPIVMMSGYDENETRRSLPPGAIGAFVSKPFTIADLEEKLRQAFAAQVVA